jgi:hypothetical protein
MLDRLYVPSAKDLATGGLNIQRYFRTISVVPAAAATVSIIDTDICPNDVVRLIDSLTFSWTPGAAQTPVNGALLLRESSSGNALTVVGSTPLYAVPAAVQSQITVAGLQLMFMQGDVAEINGTFNAGVANNAFTIQLRGWQFPRGAIQR